MFDKEKPKITVYWKEKWKKKRNDDSLICLKSITWVHTLGIFWALKRLTFLSFHFAHFIQILKQSKLKIIAVQGIDIYILLEKFNCDEALIPNGMLIRQT